MNTSIADWQLNQLDQQLITIALAEDLGSELSDATTDLLFANNPQIFTVNIISKNAIPVVVAGSPLIKAILASLTERYRIDQSVNDGEILDPGATLVTLQGEAKILLKAERTILNFLQRLCAVATLTRQFVDQVKGTALQILDTRKTTPGFRHLQKYAVFCGGGVNHRQGLYDAVLIKDTHIDLLGGIVKTLDLLPGDMQEKMPVIVEVRDEFELEVVLKNSHKINRVLLDNMDVEQLSRCVIMCKGKLLTEASGNIHLGNIREIAETGVNFASIGKLTHSAGSVDLSMKGMTNST